ncbi:hypothetical protein HZC53_05850 [Candidatus Uhrbacteria bacterium]|nr:hypothetical protein [Candidatus Uhrbacteria bacterium]
MSSDISLLPEDLRRKEEAMKTSAKQEPPKESGVDMRFFIPKEEGEDIEVIEVDEGEIDQVLAGEPTLTKFAFYATSFIDNLKSKLFKPKPIEAPPKAPPQFFKAPPPKPAEVPAKPGAPAAPSFAMPAVGAAKPAVTPAPTGAQPAVPSAKPGMNGMAAARVKAQIAPFAVTPRRVRVIRRVRKPLRVSFVTEEQARLIQVDVRKRRFTFIVTALFFVILLAGGYGLLDFQHKQAQMGMDQANTQLADVRSKISEQLKVWSSFQYLEPKLKALAGLLDQHVSPTKLLAQLEEHTLPTVSYQNFSLSADRKVNLAVTADSLDTAAKQLVVFQTAGFIKKVEATSYSVAYDSKDASKVIGVSFQAILTLSDNALNQMAVETN